MKKVVLIAITLSVALIGCTSHTNIQNTTSIPHHPQYNTNNPHHKGDKHAKKGEHPHLYVCEQNANITAKYDHKQDLAKLNITAPSLGLKTQEVQLKLTVSGSGERYLNNKNPASIYEWHTTEGRGILTITANGKEYRYSCEAKYPHLEQ